MKPRKPRGRKLSANGFVIATEKEPKPPLKWKYKRSHECSICSKRSKEVSRYRNEGACPTCIPKMVNPIIRQHAILRNKVLTKLFNYKNEHRRKKPGNNPDKGDK